MTNQELLIDIACYFSERAVMELDKEEIGEPSDKMASEIYDKVATIIAHWLD